MPCTTSRAAIAYVQAALAAGLAVDDFAPRLSFFFAAHSDLFEEAAKFRVARQLWARIVRERFEAKDERSMLLRFHTQTGGSTLTAQQPENNIIRTTVQALAATLGGTQSLHTNSYDEALGLPTEKSAEIALRTQQLLAFESGITNTVDPLAGSYYVEYLSDQLKNRVEQLMRRVEEMGGSVRCIESGYFQDEIARSAYEQQKKIEAEEMIVVGVNKYRSDKPEVPRLLRVDPDLEKKQVERLQQLRARRNQKDVTHSLERLKEAARSNVNVVGPVLKAVESYSTVGEISDVFREVWGEYHDNR